jgi:hypothetical protein
VLDLWLEQWGLRRRIGRIRPMRFADDFLVLLPTELDQPGFALMSWKG